VSNVDCIIDTETNSKNNVDSREDIDGDAPEVEEADDVHEGGDDHHEDQDDHEDVAEKKHCDDGHTEDGEQQVPHQLEPYDLIRLPGRVDLTVREKVRRISRFYGFGYRGLGRDMGFRSKKIEIVHFAL